MEMAVAGYAVSFVRNVSTRSDVTVRFPSQLTVERGKTWENKSANINKA